MSRPSILLICTDQQRYDALGAAGNPHIVTPNLDRLAAQGARFSNCYVQATVCAPSRASLMTSRYVHNHGVWANGVDVSPDEQFFTRTLADAGYDCGLAGKLHLGSAFGGRIEPRIDDGFRIFRWAHDPYLPSPGNEYHHWLRRHFPGLLEETMAQGRQAIDRLPREAHYSHWVGEETIEFLTSTRDRSAPFCFIANFFDPHHGFGAPPEYRDRYDAGALPAPVTSDLSTKPAIYSDASRESYAGALPGFTDYTAEQIQEIKAHYYAMVSLVDDEVGRILDALAQEGLEEETIVLFTSDHGEMLGDHQMLLKGPMMFDCAVRVPLIVRWPGHVPAGAVHEELVEWIDLAPTLVAAAQAEEMPRAQGRDLAPLWSGEHWPDRDWVLSEYRNSGSAYDPAVHTTMLRTHDWKLVVHHGATASTRDRDGELYDMASDPDEQVNLWHDDAFRARRLEMQSDLLDVLVATEDRSQPRIAAF
ncbi:sulfatase-like hydrolase/transferase [Ruania suaedae]|uniref:sulfatase family protein n=1 Tax=Ruania suaedae TaxID=2897774 RepID=UPI001E48E9E2|nr:sulfatase-like hydrolase/transferase [Ruania suaedae]UFU03000.1 sulfatase-like hydrolase/transferase [Ruania suaedae]